MTIAAILLIFGLAFLISGADLLVRGASRLAAIAGVPPLVVGLTVVAFGTSAPELAVSARSALAGQSDIALGNVVGSNIFNILFILGFASLIIPVSVSKQVIRQEVPIMIGVTLIGWLLAANGVIGRLEGFFLLAGIAAYTIFLIIQGRKTEKADAEAIKSKAVSEDKGNKDVSADALPAKPETRSAKSVAIAVAFVVAGLAFLVLGSDWLVDGAVRIARRYNVSELVIGLTIIAAGTSMPELATSIIGALKGERDIAVGNVVGSNVFNILAVLGAASLLSSNGVGVSPDARAVDIPVMVAAAVICLPIFFTGARISRLEGAFFLAGYIAYAIYLGLNATQSRPSDSFKTAILYVALPVSVVILTISLVRELNARRNRS
ncbi:MAG: calcium/sodium antiporter [Planctomycetota bacterium]